MNGSPINRPRIRAEIRALERQLSEATCSADRAPILDQLERKQAELRRFYAHVRTLPRFDADGTPLPRFGIHAPLEPDNNLHPRKRVGPASDERSRRHATAAATGEAVAQSTGPHGRSAAASPPSPNERKSR